MFKRKTVFVVGAGASIEFGLPSGTDLAATISKKTDIRFEGLNRQVGPGDFDLFNNLTKNMQRGVSEFQEAGWVIRDGMVFSRSIDDFLDVHRADAWIVQYGKAAIVKSILEAENASSLYNHDSTFVPEKFANTWLVKFLKMLVPGTPKESVREVFKNVSFINFNYDRCIEYFLFQGVWRLYGLAERDAHSILESLDIVHPYGAIDPGIPFGNIRASYQELSAGIKTYTDQIEDRNMIAELSEKILGADHIVFLGFAYHDQNMEILKPPKLMGASKRLFGTAYGLSDSDVEVVGHQIDSWFLSGDARAYRASMIRIENKLKCAELFDHYAKSLTG